jgi:hypothetical protein
VWWLSHGDLVAQLGSGGSAVDVVAQVGWLSMGMWWLSWDLVTQLALRIAQLGSGGSAVDLFAQL